MEDNQLEIAKQMRSLLNDARKNRTSTNESEAVDLPPVQSEEWVPDVKENEFLIRFNFENSDYLCCMREPTWPEAAAIELYAFRKTSDGREYFSGEYERRELLRKSLNWIAEINTKQIHKPNITQLSYDFVAQLWEHASKVFFVQFSEAQALYASAKSFFLGEIGNRVHPIILDVDGIIKRVFVFNATEWKSVKMSDYERYQIVWMAYSELESPAVIHEDNSQNSPKSDPRLRAILGQINKNNTRR